MKKKVYLAGQSNKHHDNWKEKVKKLPDFSFYDWEFDSDQTSPDTFFPDDLRGIKSSDYMIANPWIAPSEATWIEIGYFYSLHTKNPGDFCNDLIIVWHKERQPKWSIEFVKKTGHVVLTVDKAIEKLKEINQKVSFVNEKDIREKIDNFFRAEKESLQKLLPNSQIEHIGGTSVANSITKGDLDINIRVSKENFQTTIEVLKKIYEINQPNNWTENYASFKNDSRNLGIQLTVIDSADDYFIKQRDFLNSNPQKVLELNKIKLSFEGKNIDDYRKEKSKFFENLKL
jgi:GrpB-like predicted nucleotidyltransferase (UPF0157 family)